MLLAHHLGVEDAAGRIQGVDRRIDTQRGDVPRQDDVRIEVGSKLLWQARSRPYHGGVSDQCVVTVTRIYRDCSFRIVGVDGKDKQNGMELTIIFHSKSKTLWD